MSTLVANDGDTKFSVSDVFMSQYLTLQDISSIYPGNTYNIDLTPETLEAIVNIPLFDTFPTSTNDEVIDVVNLIRGLDYLGANDEVWKKWITKLPRDYDILLPDYLVEKIWNIDVGNDASHARHSHAKTTSQTMLDQFPTPVPKSYYDTEDEKYSWTRLLSLVAKTLNTKINYIYVAYLIMIRLRKNNITITEYEGIVDNADDYDITIEKSNDILFTYPAKMYDNTTIYSGYVEIFALLTTADNDFMCENIFTFSPEELGKDFHSLIVNYQSEKITEVDPFKVGSGDAYDMYGPNVEVLDLDSPVSVPYDMPVEIEKYKPITLPSPVPIMQRLFRLWSINGINRKNNSLSVTVINWKDSGTKSMDELSQDYLRSLVNYYATHSTVFKRYVEYMDCYSDILELMEDKNAAVDLVEVIGKANAEFVYTILK